MLCPAAHEVNVRLGGNIAICKGIFAKSYRCASALPQVMRSQRTRYQYQPADQQDQHDHGVEKAGGTKINVHVGDDPREDEQRSADRQQPTQPTLPVPKQNAYAEQHRQKRNPETIPAPKAPVRSNDAHLVGDQKSPHASHRKSQKEMPDSARSSTHIGERTVSHDERIAPQGGTETHEELRSCSS